MGERISGGTGPDNQEMAMSGPHDVSLTQMPFHINTQQSN